MLQRLSKVLIALSLLISVAVVALWVRSYYIPDDIIYAWPSTTIGPWSKQQMMGLRTRDGRVLAGFCEQRLDETFDGWNPRGFAHKPDHYYYQTIAGWAWSTSQGACHPFDDLDQDESVGYPDMHVEFTKDIFDDTSIFASAKPPTLAERIWAQLICVQFHFSPANSIYTRGDTRHGWTLDFPMWFPLAIISLPLWYWPIRQLIIRHRRKTLERVGKCVTCGYDLRKR